MTPEQIQKMAEGFRPSCIGKDHEEVVVWLANHHIALQEQVNALTAESVRIKICNDVLSEELRGYESDGAYPEPIAHKLWYSAEHQETDHLLAERDREIEARGAKTALTQFARQWREESDRNGEFIGLSIAESAGRYAEEFAARLRTGEAE